MVALIVIGVVTHWQWFVPGYQFRWGDSGGVPAANFPQFGTSFVNWISSTGLGSVNIQPYQSMFYQLWRIASFMGLSFSTTEQLTMLLPMALLSFVSPFLFIRRILRSDVAGFAGALVYGLSTSLLIYEGYEISLGLAFSLLPLTLFAFEVFLRRGSWKTLFGFILIFNVLIYIEVRIAFLAGLLIIWLTITLLGFRNYKFPSIWKFVSAFALLLLLNAFWVLDALTTASGSIASTTGRGIFGNNFINFSHAVTLVSGSWVNGTVNVFFLSHIPLIMWVVPILAIFGAFAHSKTDKDSQWPITLFAGAIAVSGILLGKQANPPLSSIFPFFYKHVPGFSLFRTGTDFLIIASLGYAILIGRLIASSNYSLKSFSGFSNRALAPIALACVIVYLATPAVDGRIGGLFVHRSEPSGLSQLASLVESENGFSRILWLPAVPLWSTYSLSHPSVGALDLIASGEPLQYNVPFGVTPEVAALARLSSARGLAILKQFSFQYVVLPPPDTASTGDFYAQWSHPRSFYVAWANQQPWLNKVKGYFGSYSVYRLNGQSVNKLISVKERQVVSKDFVVNSNLLVGTFSARPREGTTVFTSMLYNSNWHAYLVPARQLNDLCHMNGNTLQSCPVSTGLRLLSTLFHNRWPAIKASRVSGGELMFRIPKSSLKALDNGPSREPIGIVIIFGSAYRRLLLIILAETTFIAIFGAWVWKGLFKRKV
jgi:hypothetical protein